MENDDKRTKCSNVSKHKYLECVLEDVRVKWCQFCVFWGPVIPRLSHCIAALFLRGESVLMGHSLSRCWIRSHRREMMTQCKRTPAVGVPLTRVNQLSRVRTPGLGLRKLRPFKFLRVAKWVLSLGYGSVHAVPYPKLLNEILIPKSKTQIWEWAWTYPIETIARNLPDFSRKLTLSLGTFWHRFSL